jgi:hypothetical protein
MESEKLTRESRSGLVFSKTNQGRRPEPPIKQGGNMAQTHYTSKTKRRPKNSNRKDPSAATMAALRKLEAADKK